MLSSDMHQMHLENEIRWWDKFWKFPYKLLFGLWIYLCSELSEKNFARDGTGGIVTLRHIHIGNLRNSLFSLKIGMPYSQYVNLDSEFSDCMHPFVYVLFSMIKLYFSLDKFEKSPL